MNCDVCGQRVRVYTGDGGTSSYEPVAEEEVKQLKSEVERLKKCEFNLLNSLADTTAVLNENAQLRTKLSRAVDVLKDMADGTKCYSALELEYIARATLKELGVDG